VSSRAFIILPIALLLTACGDQSMTQQNRYGTYGKAALFRDGREAQPLPAGVVAQGDSERAEQATHPPAVDAALMQRGRERYEIFCTPCHGLAGRGDGIIVQRGFPAPPSYHGSALRRATAQHIFDTITNGHGVMYSFASRIEPRDRWAIVAYIRALQEAQNAVVAELPDARSHLP
jgi:mono/diheme cytochrome c family protein